MPLQVFPVAGNSGSFTDDFGAPRSGGRRHAGTDIFAPEGTPLLAVDAGVVSFVRGELGGNIARLVATDGATYLYTHLRDFPPNPAPVAVRAGDVIGTVGTTGNAAGGPPHVHFEVHPPGSGAVNPFPLLSALRAGISLPSSLGSGVLLLLLAFLWSRR